MNVQERAWSLSCSLTTFGRILTTFNNVFLMLARCGSKSLPSTILVQIVTSVKTTGLFSLKFTAVSCMNHGSLDFSGSAPLRRRVSTGVGKLGLKFGRTLW